MAALTQKRLKQVLDYTPETGLFTWNNTLNNKVNAGDVAGWSIRGYGYITINRKDYIAAKLAFLFMEGIYPENEVDHINRITDDNRWTNLRVVTHRENCLNKGLRKDNSSGITGIYWRDKRNKWESQIGVYGKRVFLGRYETLKEAILARIKAEKEYGFDRFQYDSNALKT